MPLPIHKPDALSPQACIPAALPMMTAYKEMGWDIKDFPNAYDYYVNLITLPLHTKLTDEDVDYVISVYKEVVSQYI